MTSALSNVGLFVVLAFPEHSILPPSVCHEPIPIPLPTLRGQLNSLEETHSNLHQDFQSSRPRPSAEPLKHKNRFPCSDLSSVPSTRRYRYLCELSIFLTCGPRCAACTINSNHASAEPQSCFEPVGHYKSNLLLATKSSRLCGRLLMCQTLHDQAFDEPSTSRSRIWTDSKKNMDCTAILPARLLDIAIKLEGPC
jgi:hypothetical protein